MKSITVYVNSAGEGVTDTLQVAAYFDKRHDNVIRDVRTLLTTEGSETSKFFRETSYVDVTGRSNPGFEMTRDGFSLLAMGFKGAKALEFKIAILNEYNRMEQTLRHRHAVTAPITQTMVAPRPVRISGALLNAMKDTLEAVGDMFDLTPQSHQAFAASLFDKVGIALPAPVIPTQTFVSTTELAARYNQSPISFGKRVKDLKCDAHGETRLTTANGKQVQVFVWNEAGVQAVADRMVSDMLDRGNNLLTD